MKAKKVASKTNKKPSKQTKPKSAPAKSKIKKAVLTKAVAKKPLAKKIAGKKSAVKKPAAKKAAAKPLAKSALAKPKLVAKAAVKKAPAFSLKSAAAKFKNAFAKKAEPTQKKAITAKTVAPVAQKAPLIKTKIQAHQPVQLPMPKGMLTEERIRKMSDKEYMNDSQLSFFRYRLLQMRNEVLARELDVKERLHQREVFADPADRATAEEEHWLDLRLRERESLLLRKIDDAMRRIADREFGYCEKTGDPIGIPRLLARPTATVCVDVKGQDERIESQFRDR